MKAKRKLTDIDFSGENAHLALTSKTLNGGPANKADYALALKSTNFSQEFIEKVQAVNITMSLPDFLKKFFYLMDDQAEALAYMMGYKEVADTQEHEDMEAQEDFQDWIKSNMESLELIEAMRDVEQPETMLIKAEEHQLLALLKDQEMFEKAFAKLEVEKESPQVVETTKADVNTSIAGEVKGKGNGPVVKKTRKGKSMTEQVTVVEQVVETEMVAKSQFEVVQKQALEQAELLKSVMQELEVFKAEKQAFIAKARKQALVDATKDEAKADQLFKAVGSLEDEQFGVVVDVVKALTNQIEKSDLFVEKGASVDTETTPTNENPVERLLKAKFQSK